MPSYFVSNGVEIPMTNETFDFIWNGFGNKELTDSETVSSSEESYEAISSVQPQNPNGESMKTERRNVFPKILPRENETTVCMRYMRFCLKLQIKLGKAQENEEVPDQLSWMPSMTEHDRAQKRPSSSISSTGVICGCFC